MSSITRSIATGVGSAGSTIYTVPAGYAAVLIGMNIANTSTSYALVDIKLSTSDTSPVTAYVLKGLYLPSGSAFTPVGSDQKIILNAGDSIIIDSSVDNSLDVIMSYALQSIT